MLLTVRYGDVLLTLEFRVVRLLVCGGAEGAALLQRLVQHDRVVLDVFAVEPLTGNPLAT